MQVTLKLGERQYSGGASWRDDDGLTVRLNALADFGTYDSAPPLPELLFARTDDYRALILVKPFVVEFGSIRFRQDAPTTTELVIRSQTIIEDLPYNFDLDTKVELVRVATLAMQLWRGDKNVRIAFDHSGTGSASFSATTFRRKLRDATLHIKQGLHLPFLPRLGDLPIRSEAVALLNYEKPKRIIDSCNDARALEGYFDLVSAFPRRTCLSSIKFSGIEQPVSMRLSLDQNEHTLDPEPHQQFMSFDLHGLARASIVEYFRRFSEIRMYQATLRHLSRDRVRLPEGFLTACNVVESLGKQAPRRTPPPTTTLDNIEATLKPTPRLQQFFNREVRPKFSSDPSFTDRLHFMSEHLTALGIELTIEPAKIRDTRGAFRHEIHRLRPSDINLMSAFIGATWVYGLTRLCLDVGIPRKALRQAVCSQRFHTVRRTGLSSWGRIAPP